MLSDESFAAEARRLIYIFKISTLSGRSCFISWVSDLARGALDREGLLIMSCTKLGLQRRS
eukprot:5624707-Amphidinium_carterae.1